MQPRKHTKKKQGVYHNVAFAIIDLKAKEELWKLKYFTMQKYHLQKKKNPLKEETKNPSTYYNSNYN
jgi:hypothetical protein